MESLLELHFPTGSIVDANWGSGTFYKRVNRDVVGVDLRDTGNVIANNQRLPFPDESFDVGVVDPPYKRGDGVKYESRYGVAPKTEQKVTRLYKAAIPELLRVCRSGIIIKSQDGTDGHRFYPRHIHIAEFMAQLTGLEPHDIAVIARNGLPYAMAQGEQHYYQQAISYFMVYKWRSKCPYKPVRF